MRRYLALGLAGLLAAISFSALAMGLGEIRLNSYLNQRLDAQIELTSAAADEIESLKIRLADHEVYERYGLERTPLLDSIRFNVVRRPNGTTYVQVTSAEPIREPFLTLFVVAEWSRGRLMREYTVLVDPPTFARSEQAVEPQPQVPAVSAPAEPDEPARQPEPRTAEPVAEEPRGEETRTGDAVTIPPLEAEAEPAAPVRRDPVRTAPELGNYGPIQRNETLWGIARRLRPDDSVTINQMMLALYRANPEAFQGNINRLKAGYILRIPGYGEITGIERRDAFNEVKRQNEEWRVGTTAAPSPAEIPAEPVEAEPELTLVAPEEESAPDLGTGIGAGGETDDLGTGTEEPVDPAEGDVDEGAMDLGVEDETADRLLDVEDESLQALQEQENSPETAETETVLPPPLPEQQQPEEQVAEEPVTDEPEATADTEQPAEDAPVAEDTTAEQDSRLAAPVVRREPSLLEKISEVALSPLGLGIGAAILVLLLAGALVMRKRREAAQAETAAAMADWEDEEGSDVTMVAGSDSEREDVTIVTGHDEDDDTAAVFTQDAEQDDVPAPAFDEDEAVPDAGQTQMISPADVDADSRTGDEFVDTMVGGQAVTLDENDPLSEADFHMAYGLYDQAAEVVQKAVERDPSRKDYHAKLAEIHFAGNNTEGFLESARALKELAGPGDSDWDNVAIMGRQIAPDDPLFEEGGSASAVDLDFEAAAAEVGAGEPVADTAPAAADLTPADDSLDFDIALDSNDESGVAEPETPVEEPAADSADELDFDLDVGGDLASDEDDAAEDAVPAESTSTQDSGDFDFDLGELEAEPTADEGKEALEGDTATGDERTDESFGDASDEQTQTEFDKALEELSAFVDTNIPEEDAGDAVADDEPELNLDDYSFDEDASAAEEAGTGEDEEDIGEVGTKLDLARAYIDMGDPDGARGILEEVVADGDEEQQKEARELLDQLA